MAEFKDYAKERNKNLNKKDDSEKNLQEMQLLFGSGLEYMTKYRRELFSRGMIMGVLTAVAVYSIIIILVLIT